MHPAHLSYLLESGLLLIQTRSLQLPQNVGGGEAESPGTADGSQPGLLRPIPAVCRSDALHRPGWLVGWCP